MKLAIIPLLVLCAAGTANGAPPNAHRPNVIFILADDLGYGDLGCYGQKKIATPVLDQMAAEGMRFTQFYAGSTVCAPSRCVLMTGRHTGHAFLRGNGRQPLPAEEVTVAEVFQKAGYRTGLIGKWGLGDVGTPGHPNRQGFDYFYGFLDQGHAHNYYPAFLIRDEERVALRNEVTPPPRRPLSGAGFATKRVDYSHDLFAEEALQWIDAHYDEPFFLYLALTIPHANNEKMKATGDGQEVPDYGAYAAKDWSPQNKGQAAMITRMDRDIGRMLVRLRKHNIDDQTLVIFTSDNGHHNEGGNDPEFFDANGPLRGKKRDLYEGGIRVPTLARWPGKIEAGTVSDHIAYFGDFFASVSELLGTKKPAGLDSISFLPTLLGEPDKQQQHDYLYWEFHEGQKKVAIRQGPWKAVRSSGFESPLELYNLHDDLGEENDLADAQPELVKQLQLLFKTARTESPDWPVVLKERN